jgi:anti-sigma-K factor RskA
MNDQCESYLPLVPDYCLGVLDVETAAALEAILPQCPELQTHVDIYRQIAEPLLHSTPPTQAPVRVFEGIIAATTPNRQTYWWHKFGQIPRWGWAAAALIVILLVSNIYWLQRNADLNQEVDDLSAKVASANNDATTFDIGYEQSPLAGNVVSQVPIGIAMNNAANIPQISNISTMNPVNQFVTRQDTAQAALTWAQGTLANTWIGVFSAQNFTTQSPENDYQLWLYDGDNAPRSAGIFDVDAFGNGILVFEIERPIEAYDEIGVTSEPAGGSSAPTGESVLQTPLRDWITAP